MRTLIIGVAFASCLFGQRSVTLTYPPSPTANVTGYSIYRNTTTSTNVANCPADPAAYSKSPAATGLSQTQSPVPFGIYCYAVSAYRGTEESTTLSAKALAIVNPFPSQLTGAASAITWTDNNPSTVGYEVWMAPAACSSAGLTFTRLNQQLLTVKTFPVPVDPTHTAECLYVRGSVTVSGNVLQSDPSNRVNVAIPPQPPPSAPTIVIEGNIVATIFQGGVQVAQRRLTISSEGDLPSLDGPVVVSITPGAAQ